MILVANYPPDAQQSMLRFSAVMERELRRRGYDIVVLAPRVVVGSGWADRGIGKWLGYIDKLLLFPFELRRALKAARLRGSNVVVHICDHSNALYTRYLARVPNIVTCNDLLAIRSACGEVPEHHTRWTGRALQRTILRGLNRAQRIACISEATRQDVLRLCRRPPLAVDRVYMGLNHPYTRIAALEADARIHRLLSATSGTTPMLEGRAFLLHVGGNQWYKNRLGVLKMYVELKNLRTESTIPALFMVGEPFTNEMRTFVREHGIGDDVVELQKVSNDDLEALYSLAELLLYPSLAEGFGWPVIEAMACGCPVVTSGRAPLTELGGSAAVYIDPDDIAGSAQAIQAVLSESVEARRARVEEGLRQQARFSTAAMVDGYCALYRDAQA